MLPARGPRRLPDALVRPPESHPLGALAFGLIMQLAFDEEDFEDVPATTTPEEFRRATRVVRASPRGEPCACSICLEPLGTLRTEIVHCGHRFHDACLLEWATNYRHCCPLCRADVGKHRLL